MCIRDSTGPKLYPCRHCSERFRRLEQLKTHLLKSHNEGTWLTCQVCQKKFSRSGHFKTHLLQHKGVKSYACSECPKCFCTSSALKSHQRVHLDFKQFCCGKCGKWFRSKQSVINHFKKCTERLPFNDNWYSSLHSTHLLT